MCGPAATQTPSNPFYDLANSNVPQNIAPWVIPMQGIGAIASGEPISQFTQHVQQELGMPFSPPQNTQAQTFDPNNLKNLLEHPPNPFASLQQSAAPQNSSGIDQLLGGNTTGFGTMNPFSLTFKSGG